MKKLKLYFFLIFINVLHIKSFAFSVADCNTLASEINKSFPMRIDKYNTIKNSMCLPDKGKFVLTYFISIDNTAINKITIESITLGRPKIVNKWCSDPSQLELLKLVPISYQYSYESGKYLGELNIDISNCKIR